MSTTEYRIELDDRVVLVTVKPGYDSHPGWCRRRLVFEVLSGPHLTTEEWDRVTAAVAAELISAGNDVLGWGC